tara:strand:+ start:2192 stop:2626 length:435 start_codon:yes stop_codon:yes gene_type:complete
MKRILLLLILSTTISFGQVLDKKVSRIAKKNIEIFLSSKYDSNKPIIVVAKTGTRKVADKNDGIANYIINALMQFGKEVSYEGEGNTLEFTIKWAAADELKRLTATIFNSESRVVGTITYNGPYIPNNQMNIAKAIAYKLVSNE